MSEVILVDEPNWLSAGQLAQQAVAETELRTAHPEMHGLSTGISSVDEKLSAILEPGRLICVAAASGSGKSAFAAQLAVAFAHQVPVLWVSLEDDGVDVAKRALANVARTPVGAIRSGYQTGVVPDSLYAAADTLANLPLVVQEHTGDVVDVAFSMRKFAQVNNLRDDAIGGVVIIDQLSHIAPTSNERRVQIERTGLPVPPRPGAPEHDRLEWQVNLLREAGRKLNLLVVLMHQLNQTRDDDGRPSMGSVRGSQGIVHKADALLVPYRPTRMPNPFAGPGEPDTVEADPNAAELICLKGRSIDSGWSIPLTWDGAHQRFAEVDEPTALYAAPEAPTPQAREGARKLAELRRRFAMERGIAVAELPEAV
jgi:replicative DNA helicase